jgi:hypothetical protein
VGYILKVGVLVDDKYKKFNSSSKITENTVHNIISECAFVYNVYIAFTCSVMLS